MVNNHQKLLIIDDDKAIWKAYQNILDRSSIPDQPTGKKLASLLTEGLSDTNSERNRPPFELSYAPQGQNGFAMVDEAVANGTPFSVAFIDIRMPPGWDGMETATRIRQIDPNIEIVIVTAYTDRSREEIVNAVGAPEKLLFLRKPFDPEELFQLALSLSEKWRLGHQEKQARLALIESEGRFRSLVETTPDFVWEMDKQGKFTYCSPVCELIYGFQPEELLGHTVFEKLIDGDEAQRYRHSFEQGIEKVVFLAGEHYEYCCRKKDGGNVYIESAGSPIVNEQGHILGFRGIDRDVTERVKIKAEKEHLEEQYRQAQKMEAIGTLAGGIAHDMNNLLTPIIGYSELCLAKGSDDPSLTNSLSIIIQSAKKAADLVSQILIFSRKKTITPAVWELNSIIQDCIKMMGRMIREDIDLSFELIEETWPLYIDKGQVEQVLFNLVVNARDAIIGNGKIVVSTKNVSIPPEQSITDAGCIEFSGDYVVLAVCDDGSGIETSTMEKIFEPFYTTKEVGSGTGLGLATVYGVIQQHNGHIVIDSVVSQGTTFYVYLPRSHKELQSVNDPTNISFIGGKETILVVEDDKAVRKLTVSMLKQLGYRVLFAENGVKAMEEFDRVDGAIDLLLSDVIMPRKNGGDLALALREKNPDLAIIFMSGYPKDMAPKKLLESPNTSYIQKPFDTSLLSEKIRKIFD